MTTAKTAGGDKDHFKGESEFPAYAPSWIDRVTGWVGRRPGPSWGYYAGLGLGLLLVQVLVLWIEGSFATGTFFAAQVFTARTIAYFLALFQYLDCWAAAALSTLRPALNATEEEYGRLRYEITTLPARPMLLASVVTLLIATVQESLWGTLSSYEALIAA